MSKKLVFLFAILLFSTFVTANAQKLPTDELSTTFAPMKWRSIGPFRGGRSNAAAGVIGDPRTYYMGTTGGGVLKTVDKGNN